MGGWGTQGISVSVAACRGRKRVLDSLEPGWQAVVSFSVWVLGTRLSSYARAVCAFNCRTISPASRHISLMGLARHCHLRWWTKDLLGPSTLWVSSIFCTGQEDLTVWDGNWSFRHYPCLGVSVSGNVWSYRRHSELGVSAVTKSWCLLFAPPYFHADISNCWPIFQKTSVIPSKKPLEHFLNYPNEKLVNLKQNNQDYLASEENQIKLCLSFIWLNSFTKKFMCKFWLHCVDLK